MSLYCCQTEVFPPRFSESANHLVKKGKDPAPEQNLIPGYLRVACGNTISFCVVNSCLKLVLFHF